MPKSLKIFIGSSTENKKYATWLQELLSDIQSTEADSFYEVSSKGWWERGVFKAMESFYESLNTLLTIYDAAILVGGKEDLIEKRGIIDFTLRDNIIFELGLFAGAKGKPLSLLVTIDLPTIPSDLMGVNIVQLKKTDDDGYFKSHSRDHIRSWLNEAKKYKKGLDVQAGDPKIEGVLTEIIRDVRDALMVDNRLFQSSIETTLNVYASEINSWSKGELSVGPDKSVPFLIALYRRAKKVFATSVKEFSSAWKDDTFGDKILKAHRDSAADVTRVFLFNEANQVYEEDIKEMEIHEKFGVKAYIFIEQDSPFDFPIDIVRDFTVIDDEIIGITESYGPNQNSARYFFKVKNKVNTFRAISSQLLEHSVRLEEFKKSWP